MLSLLTWIESSNKYPFIIVCRAKRSTISTVYRWIVASIDAIELCFCFMSPREWKERPKKKKKMKEEWTESSKRLRCRKAIVRSRHTIDGLFTYSCCYSMKRLRETKNRNPNRAAVELCGLLRDHINFVRQRQKKKTVCCCALASNAHEKWAIETFGADEWYEV